MVNGERGEQGGFAVSAGEQHEQLRFPAERGSNDPFLERLELEVDALAERQEVPIAFG